MSESYTSGRGGKAASNRRFPPATDPIFTMVLALARISKNPCIMKSLSYTFGRLGADPWMEK